MQRKPARIAITGMAGRFPGAPDIAALWEKLKQGQETISHFSETELAASEYNYQSVRQQPGYVAARGVLDGVEMFDAGFFGFRPKEAASLDPQQRVWFECAWEALEDACLTPGKFAGKIGVFAGGGYLTTYLLHNICDSREFIEELVRLRAVDSFQNIINNDKDFLPTRTSYLFGLTGPSINVQTACSTSLVAVAQAAQSLLLGESDACIAGGISIQLPQIRGYLTQDGGMESQDGHVRVFDAAANGTVFSNGAGAVVMRRLDDALADGDPIYAILDGYGLNNDGGAKPSYIAPSVDGQADVIRQALQMSQYNAETISYIEAHGTGTSMGDPIEVEALSKVFREQSQAKQYCGIGSIKSNVGHLDAAAGIAGLIKTILVLKHKEAPQTLHFKNPNPRIDFSNSPFFVVDKPSALKTSSGPLRAGVSSFGVGGTNVHVVLEEAPAIEPPATDTDDKLQLLTLSARSPEALEQKTVELASFLQHNSEPLTSVAYTLLSSREDMPQRRFLIVGDRNDAVARLAPVDKKSVVSRKAGDPASGVVFMFPGQGSQHVNMAKDLYESDAAFRDHVDQCAEILQPLLQLDLRNVLYPDAATDHATASELLAQTHIAQPALFVIEYGLARLWMDWCVQPEALVGHSLGEYTAACLAGVMSLEQALELVAARGRLMQEQTTGDMLAVRTSLEELRPLLPPKAEIAALNAPGLCVASGTSEAIEKLVKACQEAGIETTLLHTSHAFHSAMMEPALAPFRKELDRVQLKAPGIPILSSRTGKWLSEAEATDPEYWVRQLREPVLFFPAMQTLAEQSGRLFLEIGPGTTLGAFARQCGTRGTIRVVSSCGHPQDDKSARYHLLDAVGRLWLEGVNVDARKLCGISKPIKTRLPIYPFQRKRHWIEPPSTSITVEQPEQQGSTPMSSKPQAEPRLTRIRKFLLEMITDLSGEDYEEDQQALSFVELGFDSLFLTQLSTEFQNQLGIKLRFRRMLEDLSTLDSLAEFFDENLPADQFAAEEILDEPVVGQATVTTPASTATQATMPLMPQTAPANASIPADASAVERLVQGQLDLMRRQLELLQGGHADSSPAQHVSGIQANPATNTNAPTAVKTAEPVEVPEPATKSKAFGAQAKISTSSDFHMNPRQRAAFDNFCERYLTKTAKSKEFTQKNRARMADPRAVTGFQPEWKEIVYPIVVDKSKGAKLWDLDGNEYVDLTCGFGSNFLGNQPDFILEALHNQLDAGYEVGPQHPLTADVTNLICELTGTERVAFCNTGSEAVMGAMRQARTITGRSLVAIFSNSYHGIFDEVIVRGTKKLRSIAAAPGILASAVENVLVLEYGAPETLEILRERGHELAAIMAEPVQSRNPKLQPREFLHELRNIADDCGAALIFDEVITGFRIEPGGAQAYFGVKADLVTYGKIIGGGLPFAAIAGNRKFMDALDGGYWEFGDDSYPEVGVTYFAGTFVRHPLALAAAKASLEHVKSQGPELQKNLNSRTSAFASELNTFFGQTRAAINIDNFGSLCRITVSDEEPFGSLLYYYLRDRGVHIWEGFGCFLTTSHSEEDVRLIIQAFKDSVQELQEAGLLTGGKSFQDDSSDATENRLPLTEAQREIWMASQMSPLASCSYNECFTMEINGELDFEAFHTAVDWVNSRHDALWMRFNEEGDYQTAATVENLPLPLIDWTELSEEQQQVAFNEVLERHATEAFDLVNGPLIHNEVYKRSPGRFVLVSCAHHIVFDGWSAGVYIDEIGQAYSALTSNQVVNLPKAPSFGEYAAKEVNESQSEAGREALAYWHKLFSSRLEPLNLPCDRPHPPSKSFAGSSIHWEIKQSTYDACRNLAAQQNSTLYSLLLSAYFAFLNRLTGQSDIVVGIPTAGQAIIGEYGLIGHCVNILPVRMAPLSSESFSGFLKATGKAVLDAQDAQPATLGAILREANFTRLPGRSPLVEVIFNLNRKLPENNLKELECQLSEVRKRAINWDMFLNCSEEDGRLTVDCDFNTDILDEATVRAWLSVYESILDAIVRNPDVEIRSLPLLEESELQQVLDWGAGVQLKPAATDLPSLINQQAEKSPDEVAVQWQDNTMTYSEVMAKARLIAQLLMQKGIEPESGVAVCLERSILLPSVLLGIHYAGAYYLPIDPQYPKKRIDFVLRDSSAIAVICDNSTVNSVSGENIDCLLLETLLDGKIPDEATVAFDLSPEQTAYTIYTSGSSGKPKGVVISHKALVNFIQSMVREPGVTEEDRFLAVTTLSFDISGLELFAPLAAGGRLIIAPDELAEDPDALAEAIKVHDINLMQATPTHWRMLLQNGWKGSQNLRVLVGGESFPADLVSVLRSSCKAVWNMYGPTETTIWSTCYLLDADDYESGVYIGKPIANTQVYILDSEGRLLPPNMPGELCIAGAGLASGYWNRPELTSEKFAMVELGNGVAARIYHTGDLAKWTRDGNLLCLGRIDDQVKIRGHRVELGEIEAVIVSHPTIEVAIANKWQPESGDTRLIVHVKPKDPSTFDAAEIREFCKTHLPEYMVPQHVLQVGAVPLTPNGKIDRAALPPPSIATDSVEIAKKPQSDLEEKIFSIWKPILAVGEFGVEDNFFDLGGHSILAVKALNRMREQVEPSLTLKQMFEHPTVAQMATVVESLQLLKTDGLQSPGSEQADREEIVL